MTFPASAGTLALAGASVSNYVAQGTTTTPTVVGTPVGISSSGATITFPAGSYTFTYSEPDLVASAVGGYNATFTTSGFSNLANAGYGPIGYAGTAGTSYSLNWTQYLTCTSSATLTYSNRTNISTSAGYYIVARSFP